MADIANICYRFGMFFKDLKEPFIARSTFRSLLNKWSIDKVSLVVDLLKGRL